MRNKRRFLAHTRPSTALPRATQPYDLRNNTELLRDLNPFATNVRQVAPLLHTQEPLELRLQDQPRVAEMAAIFARQTRSTAAGTVIWSAADSQRRHIRAIDSMYLPIQPTSRRRPGGRSETRQQSNLLYHGDL